MSKFVKSLVLAVSTLMMAIMVVGCSSVFTPDKPPNMTKGVTFGEIKVMVFQPPT